ncbi:MAG TPA: ACT domain-containing protein [Candidatus Limnocylindrales bacterium]|nr:ACT domain-containing protein [Candidatus Limnocylindrales bacterium]
MTVWFTIQLDDRPGSLGRVATALGERGVNITAIVGIAEDTDGALMLETSDPVATAAALEALGVAFERHDAGAGSAPDRGAVADLGRGRV